MRNLATLITAASLGALFTVPLPGHAKPLPPAFGGSYKPEAAEIEEQPRVRKKAKPDLGPKLFRRVSPGEKVHIHIDGDVDGGGDFSGDRARRRGRGDGGDGEIDGGGSGGAEGGDDF